MAAALHADVCRAHPAVAWAVLDDLPACPGKLVARLVTGRLSEYVLVADTLAELRAQLPPGSIVPSGSPASRRTWWSYG